MFGRGPVKGLVEAENSGSLSFDVLTSSCYAFFYRRGGLDSCRVVRVKVNRDADFLLEGFDQEFGRLRLAETGHVLDGQNMTPHVFELFGQVHLVPDQARYA